jgi:hypothetical protein
LIGEDDTLLTEGGLGIWKSSEGDFEDNGTSRLWQLLFITLRLSKLRVAASRMPDLLLRDPVEGFFPAGGLGMQMSSELLMELQEACPVTNSTRIRDPVYFITLNVLMFLSTFCLLFAVDDLAYEVFHVVCLMLL